MRGWLDRLRGGPPLLLDGATGTELERRGVRCALPLWSAHALVHQPELVRRVHADYVAAGAELLTANTFRTQQRTLDRGGAGPRAPELTALAVALARAAAAEAPRPVAVLGSAPPLEDCYSPRLVPDDAALAREHAGHCQNLAASGVDAILVETMNTLREARAALRAARATALPALASFVCGSGARLLSGEPLGEAVALARDEGAVAVLVNCLPIRDVPACLPVLSAGPLPFGAYANLGAPEPEGWRRDDRPPEEFAEAARGWLDAGAVVVGGCCGTTPAHIAALAQLLRSETPGP
jgi:S-methylmethionine-dependent homocysteine/selenocysteine methylase